MFTQSDIATTRLPEGPGLTVRNVVAQLPPGKDNRQTIPDKENLTIIAVSP